MKRTVVTVTIAAAALCLFARAPAHALSLGGYFEAGGGTAKVEHPNSRADVDDSQVDAGAIGGGFSLDTAVRGPSIFNYRLHLGFGGQGYYDDSDRYVAVGGIVLDNIFGFALVRTDRFRLWIGPTLRLGYYSGHLYNEDYYDYGGHHHDDEVGDYHAYAVGGGLALGANFAVGRSFNICPTIGYRYTKHYGSWNTDSSYGDRDGDARGWTSMGYAGVDFLVDLP
jgi:hypothetical protein